MGFIKSIYAIPFFIESTTTPQTMNSIPKYVLILKSDNPQVYKNK